MKKFVLSIISLLIGSGFIRLSHSLSFDSREMNILGYKIDASQEFPNFYIKYFYNKDNNPIYIWKDSVFRDYADNCHDNNKNCMVFAHQQLYSDIIWMGSIQYLGSVIDASQARYMYGMLDNLTNLNPYWDYPYVFGELIIPISKTKKRSTEEEKKSSWIESVKLGEKGKLYNCDREKLSEINNMTTKEFYDIVIEKNNWDDYKDICDHIDIPGYLGFNYFYYLKDWENSSLNYKIASFYDYAPTVYPSMVAIVSGRAGEHIKSMQVWFAQLMSITDKLGQLKSDEEIELYKNKEEEAWDKALFELHLYILQQTSSKITNDAECVQDYDCLVNKGYIRGTLIDILKKCETLNLQEFKPDSQIVISKDEEEYLEKVKCTVFAYGVFKKYIDLDTGYLKYPRKHGDEEFEYKRDIDQEDRRIGIPVLSR